MNQKDIVHFYYSFHSHQVLQNMYLYLNYNRIQPYNRYQYYSYRFYNDRQMCALGRQYRAHVPVMMDTDRMRASALVLLGTHDFAAFAASGSVAKTTVRTVHALRIDRRGPEVTLWILGNGFLYNMVRIIAGTLQEIGTGKRSGDAFQQALSRKDRLLLGQTAPAQGLTLEAVFYEGEEERLLEFFTQDEIKGR